MMGPCPFDCYNKTEYGYCKNTGCINSAYQQIVFNDTGGNGYQSPCTDCTNNPANGGSGICHCVLGTSTIT